MLSVIAHEMAEMASDPFSSAWVNDTSADSSEIGDICSWEFGTSYKTSDGRDFTLLGSDASSFFIQQIWNRFEGRCVASTVIPPNVCGGQYDGFPCPQNGTCSASGFCIRSKNIQPPTNPPPLPHPPPPPLPSPSPSPPPPSIPAPTPSAGISIVPKKKRRRHRRHLIANSNVFQPLRGWSSLIPYSPSPLHDSREKEWHSTPSSSLDSSRMSCEYLLSIYNNQCCLLGLNVCYDRNTMSVPFGSRNVIYIVDMAYVVHLIVRVGGYSFMKVR